MEWQAAYEIVQDMTPDWPEIRYHKCQAVFQLARKVQRGCIVELGTFQGLTAITMALANPAVTVYAVDDYIDKQGWAGEPYARADEKALRDNIARAQVTNVVPTLGDVEALAQTWDKPVGLLFWDIGGQRLRSDFEKWARHIATRGVFAVKDIAFLNGFGVGELFADLDRRQWRAHQMFAKGHVYSVKRVRSA